MIEELKNETNLFEGEGLTGGFVETDVFILPGANALFDETQQVLLVHAGRCVHVCVHLHIEKEAIFEE